jgi:hypothetical protein
MARLIITGGFGKAFRYDVQEGETVTGREDAVDLVLPNNSVSRQHARLSWDGTRLQVVDLDSRNGIKLNGEKVKEATLVHGDRLSIGKFNLTYTSPDTTLFEGRFIQYMDEYTPAATASRSATMAVGDGGTEAILEHIKESARIVVTDDASRFWIPAEHTLTFGGGGLVDVGGLFTGGLVAELTWGEAGHSLTKLKGMATVKHKGKGTKAAQLKPGDSFQVGSTRFLYEVPGF